MLDGLVGLISLRPGALASLDLNGRVEKDAYQTTLNMYNEECARYSTAVVQGIQTMCVDVPASQVDMEDVGSIVVDTILAEVARHLAAEPGLEPEVARSIYAGLAVGQESTMSPGSSHDEWLKRFRVRARALQQEDQQAVVGGAEAAGEDAQEVAASSQDDVAAATPPRTTTVAQQSTTPEGR
mmetsp:Transcript_33659/g.89480  ORF Transcript_33659/g.89480 Transcript_33659/m.89480 type:complete len:183 (+) Transcript_33659:554-1102(+)